MPREKMVKGSEIRSIRRIGQYCTQRVARVGITFKYLRTNVYVALHAVESVLGLSRSVHLPY